MIIIIIITNNNTDINNDYNDSNRKGKALKVATKKTLKIKKILLAWFLKRDCLEVLAVSFPKINQVSFVAIISFSLIIVVIVIITIVFFNSHNIYLTLFQFIFILA